MIRVMVVEDEPFASRRIRRLIELVDPSFQVVATAMDGEEALEILAHTPCDLVFTDIRMPVMDGVELMKRLRADWPECMIVVVSGYSDFTYVSTALRMEATDYILKPIAEKDMQALLERIRSEYFSRQDEALRSELASRINKAVPYNRTDDRPGEEENLGVFLFCAGAFPICENSDLCPGSEYWGRIGFGKMVESSLSDMTQFSWEFMGTTSSERIVIIKSESGDMSLPARYLYNKVSAQSAMPVTCVCCSRPTSLRGVEGVLKDLRAVLATQLRIGQSRFIALNDRHEEEPDRSASFEPILPEARKLLSGIYPTPDKNSLTPLFHQFEQENWSQNDLSTLFGIALNQLCSENAVPHVEAQQLRNALAESFSSALSLRELQEDVFALCAVHSEADRLRKPDESIPKKIANYLEGHYTEHITNQSLAAIYGYVPSYLSTLFRKEYKVSPVEYLTNIRIAQAKRMLRENPDVLIKDVAESVGFKSQHHFSHTFKKYENVWPTNYKGQNQ